MTAPSCRMHSTATRADSALLDQVEAWLIRWGTTYQREHQWRVYDAAREESFRFRLDFLIDPMSGRKPSHYLALDIRPDHLPAVQLERHAARSALLRTLWYGQFLTLDAQLLRVDPTLAQDRLLRAL